MTDHKNLFCPFDKHPCIRDRCAIWSGAHDACTISLLSRLVPPPPRPPTPEPKRESPPSSGISEKFRDPLFD